MNRRMFKLTVNSMLLVLLLAILVFPASTSSWIGIQQASEVLPASTSNLDPSYEWERTAPVSDEELHEFFYVETTPEATYADEESDEELFEEEPFPSTLETVEDTQLEQ